LKPRIDFIYVDSGGGHRAAANALSEVIAQQGREWDIRLLSIQDLLAPIDFIRKTTGIEFEEVYNIILRKGWSAITGPLLPLAHTLIKASHGAQVEELAKFWAVDPPAMVVSLIPHYNRALFQALARVNPSAPYVTVLTDVADYPPDFWIDRQRQYVICGSDKAVRQARKLGYGEEQIRQASGLIVHPKFYAPLTLDRAAERKRLGLDPDRTTGLVLFGGEGSPEIPKIAAAVDAAGIDTQLILVCGRNEQAAEASRKLKTRVSMFVEGFTRELPRYMALSDYLIGKPGPGVLSEAFLMKLPVIVERNVGTMPQERYNTEWVEELGAGIVVRHFREIGTAVRNLLQPERLAACREAVSKIQNRAVFEIPEMLAGILQKGALSESVTDAASH
jgi:1,2-diacylglycerol 3-beta-galactosyltransferase